MEPLLQLRQGAQVGHQGGAHRPQGPLLDLAPQPPRRRQGGGHIQQSLAAGGAALGATEHGGGDVRHAAEAQAALQHPIEAEQLGGFRQELPAFPAAGRQGKGSAMALTGGGAGEASHMGRQTGPLQEFKGLGGDGGGRLGEQPGRVVALGDLLQRCRRSFAIPSLGEGAWANASFTSSSPSPTAEPPETPSALAPIARDAAPPPSIKSSPARVLTPGRSPRG